MAVLFGLWGAHRIYLRQWRGFLFPLGFLVLLIAGGFFLSPENFDIYVLYIFSFMLIISWADGINLIRTKRESWDNKYRFKPNKTNWPAFIYILFLLPLGGSNNIYKEYNANIEKLNAALNKENYVQAKFYAEKLAYNGKPDIQNIIGQMYEAGHGYPQDYIKARDWYTLSANQNYAAAQNNLGRLYLDGIDVPKNYEKALDLFNKASDQGLAEAQYNIGVKYNNGYGVNPDPKKAKDYYQKAANKGVAAAQNDLGIIYILGEGIEKNDEKGFYWINKAANEGFLVAENNLGIMYRDGVGVSQDYAQAAIFSGRQQIKIIPLHNITLGLCIRKDWG